MKLLIFLLLFSVSQSCRSMSVDNPKSESLARTDGDLILQLEVGSKNATDGNSKYSNCQVDRNQLSDLSSTILMIREAAKKPVETAVIFTPFSPSFTYSAYLDGKQILLKKGDSTLKFRSGEETKKLISILDEQCKQRESQSDSLSKPATRINKSSP